MPRRLGKELFKEMSFEIHGYKYDYSHVDYRNNYTNVTIVCPDHGPFEQTPQNHLKGSGCSACVNRYKWDTESFIQRSLEIHGDLYDYSEVNYINAHTKVTIICREHGPFYQEPRHHSNGHGCRSCGWGTFPSQHSEN